MGFIQNNKSKNSVFEWESPTQAKPKMAPPVSMNGSDTNDFHILDDLVPTI